VEPGQPSPFPISPKTTNYDDFCVTVNCRNPPYPCQSNMHSTTPGKHYKQGKLPTRIAGITMAGMFASHWRIYNYIHKQYHNTDATHHDHAYAQYHNPVHYTSVQCTHHDAAPNNLSTKATMAGKMLRVDRAMHSKQHVLWSIEMLSSHYLSLHINVSNCDGTLPRMRTNGRTYARIDAECSDATCGMTAHAQWAAAPPPRGPLLPPQGPCSQRLA
jgi:hypothetical protein